MKKLLLATTALIAFAEAASAETIVATARVDNVLVATDSSATGQLNIIGQSFGPVFNLNTLQLNSQSTLAPPGILFTNTFDVNAILGGTHTLVLDIVAAGLTGPNALTSLLSSFSITGLPDLWSAREQTFINNNLLSDTGLFTATSDNAFETKSAFLGATYNAEVLYTINAVGRGNFNGGIDISVASPVPEPSTWALMLVGFAGLAWMGMRKRRNAREWHGGEYIAQSPAG